MKLNHINLPVKDVPTAREFFEGFLGFRSADDKPNDTLSVLHGKDGFVLVLMAERLNKDGNHTYPDAFHIGFLQDGEEAVNIIYEQLKAAGVHLEHEPQRIRKTFGFYFRYQNILMEIATL